jgi:hypothetical protein
MRGEPAHWIKIVLQFAYAIDSEQYYFIETVIQSTFCGISQPSCAEQRFVMFSIRLRKYSRAV